MLGHASLATTQIYTHLSIGKLKKVHSMTHPSATMKGLTKTAAASVGEAVTVIPEVEREALFGTLDAEDDDPQDGV
jgi:integrase/recombinase XerD